MILSQKSDLSLRADRGSLRINPAKFFIYSFLIAGYLNTILRLNPESDVTLFRALLPLAFIYFLLNSPRPFASFLIVILLLFGYSLFNSLSFSRQHYFNLIYVLHYISILFLLFLSFHLTKKYGIESMYNHVRGVYVFAIFLCFCQFLTGFTFPNTENLGTINIYYAVDNDLSAALVACIPLLLISRRQVWINRILAILGLIIILYNGSRIALLAILFFVVVHALNRGNWAGWVLSAAALMLLFFLFKNYSLGGDTIYDLLITPFQHIFSLTPYESAGSIYDRTNGLIFGIKELINSKGFGIGPGNATRMFELPEYFLPTAQSMHNFIAQVFVELGWLALAGSMLISAWITSYRNKRRASKGIVLMIYLLTVALASLSQSEGLFSNYYFFICVFFSFSFIGDPVMFKSETTDSRKSLRQ